MAPKSLDGQAPLVSRLKRRIATPSTGKLVVQATDLQAVI